MKAGRQVKQMPDLTRVVDTFGKEWWAWWAHLQNGRLAEFPQPSREVSSPTMEDIQDGVMKGGPNSIFLVLLSLAWWGLAVCDQGEDKVASWDCAFHDFNMVLELMHDNLCTTTAIKRHGDKLETSRGKHPRYVLLFTKCLLRGLNHLSRRI